MSRFKPASKEEVARRGSDTVKVRARNENGTLKADDPSTPDVNEAYVWADKPVKKRGRPAKKKE